MKNFYSRGIARRPFISGVAARPGFEGASVAALAAGVGGSTSLMTAKKAVSPSANSFWINALAGNAGGKGAAVNFVRNNGNNDAGVAHESWRPTGNRKVDTIDQLTGSGGYASINESNGAGMYVIGFDVPGGDVPGGDFHGGETLVGSQIWTCDGVPFDPTVDTPTGINFEHTRKSRIARDANPSVYVEIDYYLQWQKNDTVRQVFTATPNTPFLTSATSGSLTLGMVSHRYTQLWDEAGTLLLKQYTIGVPEEFDLTIATSGGCRMVDPVTGDWVIFRFTVSRTPDRVYTRFDSSVNFHKFYVRTGAITLSTPYTVTQEKQFYSALPASITAPFTEPFSGSALAAPWKEIVAGNATLTVSGGVLRLAGLGGTRKEIVLPINPTNGPGNYRVEIDYKTDTAATSGRASIGRSDTTSNTNPLVATSNFNSTSPTTMQLNFAIAAGETPWLRIASTDQATRAVDISEIRITKL